MNVSTATPADLDTEIARLETIFANAQAHQDQAQDTINRIDNLGEDSYERSYPWNSPAKRAEAVLALEAAVEVQDYAREALYPLTAEFTKRGGWTRFYLVTNGNGHVHWTTACNTCFPTTQFAWLTEQSGMTHDALVEMAGEMACTVCFPNAPVDVLKRKGTLEAPERKAAREEREAKRAAKAAAEVVVEGYVEHHVHNERVITRTFKTVRAVTNDIASNLSSLCHYGVEHPSSQAWITSIAACRKALEERGEEYDYDKALATARKRVEKQNRTGRWGDPTWNAQY